MYFCAFGILFVIPVAYLVCQALTWFVYEGKWRTWSLLPIVVVILALLPLLFVRDEFWVFGIILGAPGLGLVALWCVWGAYTHSQRAAVEAAEGAEDGESPQQPGA